MRHINYFKRAFFILMALCITGVAFGQDLLFENISNNPDAPYGLEGPVAGENYSAQNAQKLFPAKGALNGHPKTIADDFPLRKGFKWDVDSVQLASNIAITGTQKVYWRVISTARTNVTGSEGYGMNALFPRADWDYPNQLWGDLSTDAFHAYRDTNIVKKRLSAKGADPSNPANIITENLYIVTLTPPTALSLEGIDDTYYFEFFSNEVFSAVAPSVEAVGNYASTGNGLKGLKDAAGDAMYKILNDPYDAPVGKSWQGFWFKVFGKETVTTAPLAATGLNLNATDNNALTATLSWTNPTTDGNGDALVNTSVHVVANGNIIHTQDLADATSNVVVNLPDHGQYDITIVIENEVNKSRPSNEIATPFVGTKPPVAASAFTAVADAAPAYTVQLAWTNPTTNSFDNGALEALDTVFVNVNGVYTDTIAYVGTAGIDNPDETLEVTVDSPGDYDFSIVARNAGGDSETALESTYVGPKTPAAIADLDITVDNPAPARDLTFTWTNPTDNVDGVALTQLNTVYVLFGTDTIKTYDSPVLGEAVTFNYTATISGELTFTVLAKNDAGESSADFTTAWVGSKMVAAIADADVQINAAPDRNVTFTWTNPTEDVEGNPITEFTGVIFQTGPHWVDTIFYASVAEATAAGTRTHTVEVPDAGDYGYKVWVFNSTGKERSNVVRPGWIGPRIAQNPTELAVQANTENLEVNLRWINPSLNDQDDALTEITAIMVMNGADTLTTITDTEIGQRVTDYMITVPEAKIYNFHLVAVNAAGVSAASNVVDAWVGPTDAIADQTPVAATDLEVVYSGQNTNVTLNWMNPTVDIYGNTLVKVGAEIYANGVKVDSIGDAGTYTYDLVTPGYYTFSVKATSTFVGEAVVADEIWCGVKDANPTLSQKVANWDNKAIGGVYSKEIILKNIGFNELSISTLSTTNSVAEFVNNIVETTTLGYNETYKFYVRFNPVTKTELKDTLVITYGAGSLVATDSIALNGNADFGGYGFDFDGAFSGLTTAQKAELPGGRQIADVGYNGFGQLSLASSSNWKRDKAFNWGSNYSKYSAYLAGTSGNDDRLVLPVIKPTANDTMLTFRAYARNYTWTPSPVNVRYLVKVSTIDRHDFTGSTKIYETNKSLNAFNYHDFGTIKVDLSDYVGEDSIYVCIQATGNAEFAVDDIYAPFARDYADIVFNIKDTAGVALPGAQVNFTSGKEFWYANDTGGIVVENYPVGEYWYWLSIPGYQVVKPNGTKADQLNWEINTLKYGDFNLGYPNFKWQPKTYTLTFNVKDEAGNIIEGAEVIFGDSTKVTPDHGQVSFKSLHTYGEKIAYKVSYGDLRVVTGEFAVSGGKTTNVTLQALYDYNFNVTDGTNAIEGATVVLGGQTLLTDANGDVHFSDTAGEFIYTVSADKFHNFSDTIFEGAIPAVENVVLDYVKYNAYFTYTDDTDAAIVGATISVDGVDIVTDANGQAVVSNLPIATYNFNATLDGYLPQTGTFDVVDWDVKVNPTSEKTITTFVVTDGTNVLENVEVTVDGQTGTTNSNGEVQFNLNNGTYSYTATLAKYVDVTGSVVVADAHITESLEMSLAKFYAVFVVTNGTDALEGAIIDINGVTLTTDAAGKDSIELVMDTFAYTVESNGYHAKTGSVEIADYTVTNVTLDLIKYNVTFNYTDGTTGLEGAEFAFNGETKTTDVSGQVVFTEVAPATDIEYTATLAGYMPVTNTVTVVNADVTVDIETELVYSVTFVVTDGTSAVSGADVDFNGEFFTTDANGEVTFENVKVADAQAYTVYRTNYLDVEGTVNVVNANVTENVVINTPATSVNFTVTDGTNPVDGVEVTLGDKTKPTNADGLVSFSVLDGNYNYTTSLYGYTSASGTVTVAGNNVNENLEISLIKYYVVFNVTDENGVVSGATVTIDGNTLTTDVNGKDSVELAMASYDYTVNKAGYYQSEGNVLVESKVSENVTLDIIKYNVAFNFSDGTNGLAEATFVFNGETKTTDSQGKVTFTEVAPGTGLEYTATLDGYNTVVATVDVADADVNVDVNTTQTLVTFTVTDGTNAIEGAELSINGGVETTNANGVVSLNLLNGDYNYTVNFAGYNTYEGSVNVNGADVSENITLELTKYWAVFTVTDENGVVEGASIAIDGQTLTTDAEGKANVELVLLNNTFAYTVSKEGYINATGTIDIANGDVAEAVDFQLVKFAVNFTVTNGTDALEGAVISINGETLTTNVNGAASASYVPGTYEYSISNDGYFVETGSVTLTNADVNEAVALTLEEYAVTFNLTDENGNIAEADVYLNINEYVFATDANGVATIDVVPGVYDYEVKTDAHITATGTITVTNAAVDEAVKLTLIKYTATFVVSNENGVVEGAEIAIDGQTLTTDAEGKATFTAVPETYEYTVSEADHHSTTTNLVLNVDELQEEVTLDLVKFYIVFNVSDENGVVAGASIAIEGETLTTDAAGMDSIYLVPGTYAYTVTGDELHTLASGEATITDAKVSVDVDIPLVKEYAVFTIANNNDAAVEGAVVSINDGAFTLTTDAAGMDSVQLVPGTYSYVVTAEEHFQTDGEFTVVLNGGAVPVAVAMNVLTHQATFNVKDSEGNKLEGVSVIVLEETILTDANGKARFELANGNYDYKVAFEGYTSASGSVIVEGTAIVENVVIDPVTYTATFVVSDGTNNLEGATVTIGETAVTTDANGEASFELVNGDYNYTVAIDGYIDATGSITVAEAAITENVTLYVEVVTYSVTFNVTNNSDKSVIVGAVVDFNGAQITTDENGVALFENIEAATDMVYTVTFENFETVTDSLDVVDSDVTENVALTPVGINDNMSINFNFYPNPATDYTVVEAETIINKVEVYNVNGQLSKVVEGQGTNELRVELSEFSEGIYYMNVNTVEGSKVERLVVE